MADIQFDLFLPQMRMTFADIEQRARIAESLGYGAIWFMDHMAPPGLPEADCFEAWTVATAIAARTERLRIGHLVLCNDFRHPALLAKMATSLDHISGGRLELGIGWGSIPDELQRFGFGLDAPRIRAARLDEALDVVTRLFTGEAVDYAGKYFQLEAAVMRPTPLQQPLPLHLGGAGPRLTLPLVAKHAHWWNCPAYGIDRLAELRPRLGHLRVSAQHPLGLAVDASERDAVVASTERRFGSWGGIIAGTPDEVVAALQAEVDLGVERFVLQFHDFGEPRSLRAFAEQVIPAVRGRE